MTERRLIYCFCAALALHASGFLTSLTGSKRPVVASVQKPREATMIPLAVEEGPEPPPPAEPELPPVPPEPTPSPPSPAEPVEPLAEQPTRPRVAVVPPAPARERAQKRSEPHRDERKRVVEDARAFGGKKGAF